MLGKNFHLHHCAAWLLFSLVMIMFSFSKVTLAEEIHPALAPEPTQASPAAPSTEPTTSLNLLAVKTIESPELPLEAPLNIDVTSSNQESLTTEKKLSEPTTEQHPTPSHNSADIENSGKSVITEKTENFNVFSAATSADNKARQSIIKRWDSYLNQLDQFSGNDAKKQQTAAALQQTLFDDIAKLQNSILNPELDPLSIDHDTKNESLTAQWDRIESNRLSIHYLLLIREHLWQIAKNNRQGELIGYSAVGVNSAKRELHFLLFSFKVHTHWLILWANKNLQDIATSPVPQIVLILKILFFSFLLIIGLRATKTIYSESSNSISISPLISRGQRWLNILRIPLALWMYFYFCFNSIYFVTRLPEAELVLLILNTVFSGYISFCIFMMWLTARPSLNNLAPDIKARIIVIPKHLFLISLFLLMKNDISGYLLGRGTLDEWISHLATLTLILYCIIQLHRWNSFLLNSVATHVKFTSKLSSLLHQKMPFKAFSSCSAITLLLMQSIRSRVAFFIHENSNARKLMAYWSRQEINKFTDDQKNQDKQLISDNDALVFSKQFTPDQYISYSDSSLSEINTLLIKEERCFISIIGPRGIGKTSLLHRLKTDDGVDIKYLSCPYINDDIYQKLATLLGIKTFESNEQLLSVLKKHPKTTICLDDCQRLIVPSIGGLNVFEQLITLMSQSSQHISWVMAFESPAWQFFSRVRGERIIFDKVIKLPPWNEKQIFDLINQRCINENITPDFSTLFLPTTKKQKWLEGSQNKNDAVNSNKGNVKKASIEIEEPDTDKQKELVNEANKAELQMKSYVRVLWDYSGGNPTTSLWAWRRSLFRKRDCNGMVVGLFKPANDRELDSLPNLMLFVLKTILQMDKASMTSIATATNLSNKEVDDAVRYLMGRGYIERQNGQFSISADWFRPISVLLTRQHLLQEI
jgi:DNA-binding MarR family transcriptional regulator